MDPLATPDDVGNVWRPVADTEIDRVTWLIEVASGKLRQQCPFDIDARMALYRSDPSALTALNPLTVASVVATIVKRFLVNPVGVASESDGTGPYSHSATYVNRYDKTGSDVRGAIQVTPADIDELRPATPTRIPGALQLVPTRAMQPDVGFWPGGYRPQLDPVTGEPLFGLRDVPRSGQGVPYQAVITLYQSTILAYGREYIVTGTQPVTLALPTPATGSSVRVRVGDDYTGPAVLVTAPAGIDFATGLTIDIYEMSAGMDRRFSYDGAVVQVI